MNDRFQPDKRSRPLALPLALAACLALSAPAWAADNVRGAGRLAPAATRPAAAKVLSASALSFGRVVLHSDLPVIVDFWAPWCLPCKELDGPMSEVAAKLAGRARVVRVNLDWSGGVARRYGVQALPTVLVFKGGELVGRSTGGASAQDLEDLLGLDAAAAAPAPAPVATAASR
jgi:thioredoxin 1